MCIFTSVFTLLFLFSVFIRFCRCFLFILLIVSAFFVILQITLQELVFGPFLLDLCIEIYVEIKSNANSAFCFFWFGLGLSKNWGKKLTCTNFFGRLACVLDFAIAAFLFVSVEPFEMVGVWKAAWSRRTRTSRRSRNSAHVVGHNGNGSVTAGVSVEIARNVKQVVASLGILCRIGKLSIALVDLAPAGTSSITYK